MNTEELVQDTDGEPGSSPNILLSSLNSSLSFIEANGWFILIGCIICYYIYNYFRQRIFSVSNKTNSYTRVDEDEALKRLKSIEAARERQQAAFEASKAKFLEEKKRKEEEEAKKRIEEWEAHKQGIGYKNKTKKQTENKEDELSSLGLSSANTNKKPKLRNSDYNPLTGSTNNQENVCYRPSRRGGSSRGG